MSKIKINKDKPLKWCSQYPLQCICDGNDCKIKKQAKIKGIDQIIKEKY